MKIQYMSDLHLEYATNREYFQANPIEPLGNILVLAGDIVSEPSRIEATAFFEEVEKKFDFVISTFGNHEFYSSYVDFAYPSYEKYLAPNHVLLNNKSFVIDKVKFIVTCLWSEVDPAHELEISFRLNDYRQIKLSNKDNSENLKVKDTNYFNKISKEFLAEELKKPFDGKVVVITHHLPSVNCANPKWHNSTIISAFVNYMDDFILNNKIDYWIFGHQHEFVKMNIGNTLMLSNPLGYAREPNFQTFRSDKVFEV